jgi:hypothetical protein
MLERQGKGGKTGETGEEFDFFQTPDAAFRELTFSSMTGTEKAITRKPSPVSPVSQIVPAFR